MITCSTLTGKAVCKLVWNMDKRKNIHYLELALSGIPKGFGGKMLEVPVGTGVLTMPVYEALADADITCLDYSPDMMERARRQAGKRGLKNVRFVQGDVGKLPFPGGSFDLVLSLNGFHAFPMQERRHRIFMTVLVKCTEEKWLGNQDRTWPEKQKTFGYKLMNESRLLWRPRFCYD